MTRVPTAELDVPRPVELSQQAEWNSGFQHRNFFPASEHGPGHADTPGIHVSARGVQGTHVPHGEPTRDTRACGGPLPSYLGWGRGAVLGSVWPFTRAGIPGSEWRAGGPEGGASALPSASPQEDWGWCQALGTQETSLSV